MGSRPSFLGRHFAHSVCYKDTGRSLGAGFAVAVRPAWPSLRPQVHPPRVAFAHCPSPALRVERPRCKLHLSCSAHQTTRSARLGILHLARMARRRTLAAADFGTEDNRAGTVAVAEPGILVFAAGRRDSSMRGRTSSRSSTQRRNRGSGRGRRGGRGQLGSRLLCLLSRAICWQSCQSVLMGI